MKVVIANSIGIDANGYHIIHSPSRWSEGVKNRYNCFTYYPWELAYTASLLKRDTKYDVKFLDGCLERLDSASYYKRILEEKPDFLVFESATRMIHENLELALKIKQALGTKLIFVGQHATAFPDELIKKGVDYVCQGEYEYSVLEILKGKEEKSILGVYPNSRRPLLDVNSLPWPEDEDVSRLDYGMPGEPSSEFREIQMYASRGCLFKCNFCVARHVYYGQSNWRVRKIDNIIAEISCLMKKYSAMQGIFFDEEVHNANKQFILDLSKAIISSGLDNLYYEAMCDVRFLDEDVLWAMKKAGYYKIRIGIETASTKIMKGINKNIDIGLIWQRLQIAKQIGLKTYGTFIFGALGSDHIEDAKTITLMKNLIANRLLDNLQISICTPQPGTPFYEEAKTKNYLRNNLEFNEYDGGNFSLVNYPMYNSKDIEGMKKKAFLIRDHYFLKAKMNKQSFWPWLKSIYVRCGIKGAISKAIARLLRELQYQGIRLCK